MPLPPFLQRKAKAAESGGGDPSPVQEARTRARRRLIGAVVLLAVGVVVFPLLFESKPRPVPVDIPIEIARREPPAALLPPPVRPAAAAAASRPAAPAVALPLPADSGIESPAPAAPVASAAQASRAAPAPALFSAPGKPVAPSPEVADASRPAADVASAPKTGRFVVQVGAYTDPTALRESRQKVEKIGLKTYTQVIDTEAGKRTRVRVGPFDTRDEAEKAAVRLKGTGLPANILAL